MSRRATMYRELFNTDRDLGLSSQEKSCVRIVRRSVAEWAVIGPTDGRGYRMSLQWVKGDRRGAMIRIGCRFFTLDAAWKHWRKRKLRGEAAAIVVWALIELVIAHAKAQRLPGYKKIEFKPPKRK